MKEKVWFAAFSWLAVYPSKTLALDGPKIVQLWIDHQIKDEKRVESIRERLQSLGWLMKALKEPLARMANRADD